MSNISDLNTQIKGIENNGDISDGYHTFNELYEHRFLLFLNLVKTFGKNDVWKFNKNFDGTYYDGWFGVGIYPNDSRQITYHLPIKYYDIIDCVEYDINPFYDGHMSNDVLLRLKNMVNE